VIKTPKKLIEVALPLDAINVAAAREKSIRHGHPSTLHLWWARRPLAAARAVIFAQMVNDPGYQQGSGFRYGVNKQRATAERERLFKIIEDLVKWENTNNEVVLERARAEIRRSWRETCELNRSHPEAADLFNPEKLPGFHDPFAGGGAIPLEAQRLGLQSYASDLNPVPVIINKAMIEIPPRFVGRSPIGPIPAEERQSQLAEDWSGASGLAEDVRRYGAWIGERAKQRIGHLYPRVTISQEIVRDRPDLRPLLGQELTVVAWLWARTVTSPNPAYTGVEVPITSTYVICSKEGKEAYVDPVVSGTSIRFKVHMGTPPSHASAGSKAPGRGANFQCLLSKSPIAADYIRTEAQAQRMGSMMLAIVADSPIGRVFLDPVDDHVRTAQSASPNWKPDIPFFQDGLGFRVGNYGFTKWTDFFTSRNLVALETFSDLVSEARDRALQDAIAVGLPDDGKALVDGGTGARAYAEAVSVFLAFGVSRAADYWSSNAIWEAAGGFIAHVFTRNALPMVWDYPEGNPFSGSSGCWANTCIDWIYRVIKCLPAIGQGYAEQADAKSQAISRNKVVSTDPPYYDNIGYADLSDFFYVWLRRSMRSVYPQLFATVAVPKSDELVSTPGRHGGRAAAESFFLHGMTEAIRNIANNSHEAFPVTIYYAFKQSETGESGTTSTGWETFLDAVLRAGFAVKGTWPVRTERPGRMRDNKSNALASSVVLVCSKRAADAPTVSRREFIRELNATLPEALDEMTRGGVNSPLAPVDLSQAIIGPGMAIFSQYAEVLEADGTPMRLKTALQLINRFLAEDDFDHDTQFCLHWFEEKGWATGRFGEADVLARAKGTSVAGLQATGVVASGKGELRLLRWAELPDEWSPDTDNRLPVWEALHHLIRALNQDSESAAGALLSRMPGRAESIRALAYRLYTLCERQGWADEARAYNELVTAWSAIEQAAGEAGLIGTQTQLDI
jgi:putative DNA methylase